MKQDVVYILHTQSIVLGVFATMTMDLINWAGKRLKVHKGGSYRLIGRWFIGFSRGRFRYGNILESPPQRYELQVGFVAHYLIGIALGYLYFFSSAWFGLAAQNLKWSLGYGTLTNVLPWLIMFPAFGFGFFALKGPSDNTMLRSSFLNHLAYGAALGLGSLLTRSILGSA